MEKAVVRQLVVVELLVARRRRVFCVQTGWFFVAQANMELVWNSRNLVQKLCSRLSGHLSELKMIYRR